MSLAKVITAGSAIILVAGFATCTTKVDRGHVGVVFDQFNGGVQEEVLAPGRHLVAPWQKVNEFSTTVKTVYMSADKKEGSKENEAIKVKAKDGTLTADLTFTYSFNVDDVSEVQRRYAGDGDYIIEMLRGQIRGWVSEATSQYTTMEIHQTKTTEVNAKLTEHVQARAEKYGLTIGEVTLSETNPPDNVKAMIAENAKIDQEVKKVESELKVEEAKLEKAKKEAERKIVAAEAEQKANEIKAKGLDEKILKEKAIEKWDGKLPTTVTDNVLKSVN